MTDDASSAQFKHEVCEEVDCVVLAPPAQRQSPHRDWVLVSIHDLVPL